MATYTVTDDVIRSEEAAKHFSTADRRVLIGIRAALEILDVPVPDWARRKPTGRMPSRVIKSAHAADNHHRADYRP